MITGIVQGVGFRPFIYNLARSTGLCGTVCNTGRGVLVEVEGARDKVVTFINEVRYNPPFLACIKSIDVSEQPVQHYQEFAIRQTEGVVTGESIVPPDVATCLNCRREITNPADRHYHYPFTNCTHCGPRFTIIENLPYDRFCTSMAGFIMCDHCASEYADPGDRRFHAQPVACPDCGPRVRLVDRNGDIINDWLEHSRQLLAGGKIIAIKGLGGFHLACSAEYDAAVQRLRRLKKRPARPLAVMCRDIETVRIHCRLSPVEEKLLCSPAAPIIVLERSSSDVLSRELAPGLKTLGIMLPYTPLHLLLMEKGPKTLVMTSGNSSGLPLVADNRQALAELGEVADFFLLHNREILNKCDDSVVWVAGGETQFFRRSRGYVPQPIMVPDVNGGKTEVVLGAGGDMKNTFCLLKDEQVYLSQHIGEVVTLEGIKNYQSCLKKFCHMLKVEPVVVGYDLHPAYHSSRLVKSLYENCIGVQHHHAHMASCMAENGLDEKVIGIILDGTGYGLDGSIWGFEILQGDYAGFTREIHLEYAPLPGGERAVRNPWITAVAYLVTTLGDKGAAVTEVLFPRRQKEIAIISKMMRSNVNTPLASSCGRFFDAVSALLGVCTVNTYDGQAAIELGEMVPVHYKSILEAYPYQLEDGVIKIGSVLEGIVCDIKKKIDAGVIARRFHDTVVGMVIDAAEFVRGKSGLNKVVLSGGCWYNRYMLTAVCEILSNKGFEVYLHSQVPTGDGGLSLGQAMIVRRKK